MSRKITGQLGFNFEDEPSPSTITTTLSAFNTPFPEVAPEKPDGRKYVFWDMRYVLWYESLNATEQITEGKRLNALIDECANRARKRYENGLSDSGR